MSDIRYIVAGGLGSMLQAASSGDYGSDSLLLGFGGGVMGFAVLDSLFPGVTNVVASAAAIVSGIFVYDYFLFRL